MQSGKVITLSGINRIVWYSIIAFCLMGIMVLWIKVNNNTVSMLRTITPLGDDFNSIEISPRSPNYDQVISNLSYLASSSTLRISCIKQGQLVYWQADYEKAIAILENCSSDTEPYLKNMILGEAYWKLGRTEDAVQVWRNVQKINSYFWQQAGSAEKNKDYKLVEELFDKMMQISPEWQPARAGYWYGKSMRYLQSPESSRDDYFYAVENAIELNLDSGGRQLQLGSELYKKRDYDLAEKSLILAKHLEPFSRWAYYYLGLVYFRTERYLEAIAELNETLSIDPQFGNAYYYIAQSYLKLDQVENAVEYLQKALLISPDNPSYLAKMKDVEKLIQENSQ